MQLKRKVQTMPNELKPCPFCGGEAVVTTKTERIYNTFETFFLVRCKSCGCETSTSYEKQIVIDKWEKRC